MIMIIVNCLTDGQYCCIEKYRMAKTKACGNQRPKVPRGGMQIVNKIIFVS